MARQFNPGQLQTGSLFNISSSYAVTASYALNGGGGNIFPFSGSAVITGSLLVSGSGITGSLSGTASVALTAQTASYVLNAVSSSFATSATLATTASYILNAQTASYVLNAVSASFASTASYVVTSLTASYVQLAQTASYVTGSIFTNTNLALSASYALTSSYSLSVTGFPFSGSAVITGSLLVSGSGITGSLLGTASFAVSASTATTASYFNETDPIFVAKSGSFATTGSNTFKGNQTISGSIYLNSGSVINSTGADIIINAGVGNNAGIALYNNSFTQYLAVDDTGSYANKFTVSGLTTTQNQAVSGSITFAGGARLTNQYDYPSIDIQAGTSGYVKLLSNDQSSSVFVTNDNVVIVTSEAYGWIFNQNGTTTMPGGVTATSFTGSLFGTASQAILAQTASYVTQAVSASYVNPLTQTVAITGSLIVQNNIDSSIRNLIDTIGTASLNWDSRYLYNGNGSISLDWKDRKLYDSNVANSIHWNTRQLFKSNGTTVTLDWETGALTGSLLGTASYAIQALSASYAPGGSETFPYTGSAIISGSLEITGSLRVRGSITGSILGTASYATQALSASSAPLYLPLTGGTLSGDLSAAGRTFTFQDLTLGYGTTFGTIKTDGTTKYIGIYPNLNFETTRFFASGHVGFQNGGTYTDTGYRVQISQSNSISGSLLSIGTSNFVGTTLMTGSLNVSQGITGSLLGTASYATQTLSASNALTASYVNPLNQDVIVTGSFNISGSTTQVGNNNLLGTTNLYGSIVISGSIDASANLSIGGRLRLDPAQDPGSTNLTASFLFTSASNTDQGYDLYYRQDGNLVKFKWLEGGISSGLLYGGIISASGATIYVSSGSGVILDPNASFSEEISPQFTYVTWPNYSASATYLTSSQNTYLYADVAGTIHQQTQFFDQTQYEQAIPLGRATHPNYATITGIGSNVQTTYDSDNQQSAFIRAFGPLKIDGFSINAHPGTLGFGVGSGVAYTLGGFYPQDPNSPSHYHGNAFATSSIARAYRSGSGVRLDNNGGAFYSTVDPDYWDDGTGVLNTMSAGDWQIQRVFANPITGRVVVYYGQNTYTTKINALQYLATDSFTEGEFTAHSLIFIGYLVLKGQTNNLTDTTNNSIINAGIFRNIAGGSNSGGAVAQTLDDLGDVTITTPSNGQALIYNSGTWEDGTPSLAATASYVLQAVSASFALQALSASYAPGGGNPFPLMGTAEITGSLLVTGSVQTTGIFEVYDVNNVSTALFNSRELKDSLFNNTSINWGARWLYDNFGNASLNWGALRTAFDSNTSSSIEWGTRALKNSAGNTILDWETGTLTGTASYFDGATQIIAGTGISISPFNGKGQVTVNASAVSPFPYTGSAIISGSLEITGSLRGQVSTLSISGNTASVNMSENNFFTLTLADGTGTNISPTNINPGQTVNILVTQGLGGTGTVTFPSLVKQASGSFYTGSAVGNAVDIVTMIAFDSNNVYVSSIKNMI